MIINNLSIEGKLPVKNFEENVKLLYTYYPYFYDRAGMFWVWSSIYNKYIMTDEIDLMNLLENVLSLTEPTTQSALKQNYIEAFKRYGRLMIPNIPKKSWVQFKDKIFDYETGEFFECSSQYFFTNPINWSLEETIDTPILDNLFSSWVKKEEIPMLYEIIAFCCSSDYFLERLFTLVGSGSNGKSCYLNIIRKFISLENIATTSLDSLSNPNNRFETIKLHKKLVCIMGETNFNSIKNTELLKRLTGNKDPISYEYKNKLPFCDVNYAKIIIATNTLPTTMDKTKGFYRRWITITFPNEFNDKIDILKTINEKEYGCLARKCCNILRNLYIKRSFTKEGTVKDKEKKYEEASNPFITYLKTECTKYPGSKILFSDFYDEFEEYLKARGKRKMSKIEVSRLLREEDIEIKKLRDPTDEDTDNKKSYIMGYYRNSMIINEEDWG